ncbi:VPLPA-CTERM sorting domain-containing protein [uncultured Roseobacter sp.]|uniref:VPLPA-CTERM sorting domain-containing protein n=1 Tax=uncultured Roseobacter sp. TaxID=114847 RepID=UPI0026170894|nr:VPLPA-CTERM sorting domain-containing protein [uncultured Roseobacter sp.]
MTRILSLIAAALFATSPAQAALVADISGTPGSGQTTWTFSGTAVPDGAGSFNADSFSLATIWSGLGDFTALRASILTDIQGKARVRIDNETRWIDEVVVNDANSVRGDLFAIGVNGDENFAFSAGSEITWQGTLTVFGIDINVLSEGGLPSTFASSTFGVEGVQLDLELNIAADEISAVPLPAGGALLLSGVAGIAALRRRKKVTR